MEYIPLRTRLLAVETGLQDVRYPTGGEIKSIHKHISI